MTEDTAPPEALPSKDRRLVFGASGYIGSNLVPYLTAAGIPVRAVSRRPQVLEAHSWDGVQVMAADALDPKSLDPVLEGVDTAHYLVHSMAAGRDFGRLDLEAARNFAAAAERAGVRRIVYLGGLVPDDADSEHITSRRDTGDELRRGSVPVTELRAGIIVGPGSAAFEVMRDLVFHLPVMVTPLWVRSKSPPVALDNLLFYLLRLPEHEEAAGKTFDAAGPETLTYQDMMTTLADVAGRQPPAIIPVSVLSPRLSSYWLKLVTAVPANVARALIEGLKHDFVADTGPLETLVPQRLLGFRESVEAAFAAERQCTVQARWVEGAFRMRGRRRDHAYYAKRASGTATAESSPESVWKVVTAIGGDNRYYYLNTLWTAREVLDWMVGGRGLQHRRRHPEDLRLGDKVDSWEVIGLEPGRRLLLEFGMRAPGAGVLEFEIDERAERETVLTATAYWHPAGAAGLAYWYAMAPFHEVLFSGLTKEICRRAELSERRERRAS
ncbi:SDR family oxidoreductase [Rhodobium gokarnense]|uniref:Uncharacterized protein YbjT (DUF2867 family) n=1 Tax=Rhodobium gokarnense TaxID=364296 RepID=A0ABT3HH77_9HYPH|nr:SDR family oxidoreductase [Rhodobium gokarnense]MCW2309761.1 uncharacterized protein YbjT (DUF2867 family) [Rhodobium gokarnense]